MSETNVLKHQFVDFVPEELEEGTLYVSLRFGTASHLCCCGCGSKVVTPLQPAAWIMIFDGKTVSLDPSIGNWSFACQSHYWISRNRVVWAPKWSKERIEAARAFDKEVRTQNVSEELGATEKASSQAADVDWWRFKRRATKEQEE